ncbi:carbohydrate sulfotransferase 12-like [Siphateles boraxobius]|uniref:carbohydrate sulfotransferase 12-like n=1 Tax=Siphateles boraxobius TaxID=180520 RepID=UPI0040649B74
MAKQRQLQCFFFLGAVFVTFFIIFWNDLRYETFYPHTASSQDFTHLKLRQAHRRRMIRELCSANSSLNFAEKLIRFDQIPNKALDHLIVDDHHGVIYCFVPKVACTNWKRVMIVLSQNLKPANGAPYLDPLDIPLPVIHNHTVHKTLNKLWRRYGRFSRPLMHHKLKNYTKFLFVRDPFVRLISAFRNKFAVPDEYFYTEYASTMLQRYANISSPPDSAQEAFAADIRPSFTHFIQYLLDPLTEKENPFNEHWQQMYRLCHPCQIDYDFVGKLETLDDDTKHLLRILGLDNHIHFPPGYENRTGVDWLRDWFASISIADRRKLYNLYETDFKLFEYEKPETLLDE